MTTKEIENAKREIESSAKSFIKQPVVKVVLTAGGVIAACYASIFVMNLIAKMATSYNGMNKSIKG